MPQITKDQIIFDSSDWLAGLHPQYNTSATLSQKLFNGLANSVSFDPFRFLGYASPGYEPTQVPNMTTFDSMPINGATTFSGLYAIVGAGTKLHEVEVVGGTVTPSGTFPKTIGGTGPVFSDIIKYYVGTTPYLFYSYRLTTGWNIGRYDMSTTFVDTYMTGTAASPLASPYLATSTAPIPMIVGDDDTLIIGRQNFVHGFDGQTGANGTFVAARLTLPLGFVVTSFAKLPDTLVVFAHNQNPAGSLGGPGDVYAFFWDYSSLDPYKKVKIQGNYVSEAFEYNGSIGCWVSDASDRNLSKSNKLMIFNGSIFETVASTSDTIPIHGGVEVKGEMIYSNCGGTVYSYGSQVAGINPSLQKVGLASGTGSGMLRTFFSSGSTTITMIGSVSGSVEFLELFTTSQYSVGSFITSLADPLFGHRIRGKIKSTCVEFRGTASGGRALTVLLLNRSGTTVSTVLSAVTTVTADNLSQTTFKADSEAGQFDSLKVSASWGVGSGATSAPIISRIIINYEPIAITANA